ncbi:MAP kinase1 [Tanacetum coccineum]
MGTSFRQIPILKASFDRLQSGCLVYMMQECWAPELLLNSSAAIDVWSVGCIYIELINWKPFVSCFAHLLEAVEEALAHPYLERLHDDDDKPICSNPFYFDFEQQGTEMKLKMRMMIRDDEYDQVFICLGEAIYYPALRL